MQDDLRLDNQVCFALYAASRAVTQLYRPVLDELGITYPQYVALLVLWEDGPSSVSHLGDRLALDSGTLSPLLKRLEAGGLVTRTRSKHDERTVIVSLTADGDALRHRAAGVPRKVARATGLSRSDLAAFRQTLATLTDTVCNQHLEPVTETS